MTRLLRRSEMATTMRRYVITRGRLLIVSLGLLSAVLVIAACGGASATSTPSPADEPDNSSADLKPAEDMIGQPSDSGLSGTLPLPDTSKQSSQGVEGASMLPELGASLSSPSIQFNTNQQVGIWVTGRGEVTAVPNMAILNAAVEARATTVEEAHREAAQAMSEMIKVLNDREIQSGDIQTRFFNISPDYRFNERDRQQELVGYRVNNQIAVKIRDLDSAGIIIDELATAGGDLVRIQGISFTIEDTEVLESQARKKAVANLMAKAQEFAQLTSVQLGNPIFLSESGGFSPRAVTQLGIDRAFAEVAPVAATPISVGELTVSISVQGAFSIVP